MKITGDKPLTEDEIAYLQVHDLAKLRRIQAKQAGEEFMPKQTPHPASPDAGVTANLTPAPAPTKDTASKPPPAPPAPPAG
jgi:hypothetical protein